MIRHRYEREEGLYYLDPNAEHNRLKYSAEESTYASTHNGGYSDYSTIIWSFIDEYIRPDNPDIDNADVYSVHRGADTVSHEDSYGDTFVFNAVLQKPSVAESRDGYSELYFKLTPMTTV